MINEDMTGTSPVTTILYATTWLAPVMPLELIINAGLVLSASLRFTQTPTENGEQF